MRIDSHQHFWNYEPSTYNWIDSKMNVIQRDFSPGDLKPILDKHRIEGTVAVQAVATEEDTRFLLQLAHQHDWIKKVVGWIDFRAMDLEEQLEDLSTEEKLAGFRHISQSEPPEQLYDPLLRKGIAALQPYGFTYDVLVFPEHLKGVYDLIRDFPSQRFVLNHMAKPRIRPGEYTSWAADIKRLGELPNIHCKISGMVTEADWQLWKEEDLRPYLDQVFEVFGTKRLMYGSDWPVALVAADYDRVIGVLNRYITGLSQEEQKQIMGGNACWFYKIEDLG
jgi:L-fuconolactonase